MNKTNIISIILVIALAGGVYAFLHKKEIDDQSNISDKIGNLNTQSDFSTDNENCNKVKDLFDAIPHLTTYKDYALNNVICSNDYIVVRYNNPAGKSFDMQTILHLETDGNRFINNVSGAGYDVTEVIKTGGTDIISNLKRLENTTVNIKNNSKYSDVSYTATYKNIYSLRINMRGASLTDNVKAITFLQEYLEAFDLSSLE